MIIPYLLGRMVAPEQAHAPNTVIVWGYIFLWGVFELLAVPCIYFRRSLTELVAASVAAVLVLSVCSVFFHKEKIKRDFQEWKSLFSKKRFRTVAVLAGAVILLVIAQAAFVGVFVHIDADDAEYVAMANDAVERDDLLVADPYTGFRWESVSMKRVLDPFSYWVAAVAKILRTEPATAAHAVIPVVFVLLGYTAVYEALKRFADRIYGSGDSSGLQLAQRQQAVWTAMLFFAIIVLFGGSSTRTYGSMLLLRAWQGKAVFCGIVLPLLLAELMDIGEKADGLREDAGRWLRLAMLCLAALLTTGMSLPMVPMVIGAFGLVYGSERILRKSQRVN